jgi:hypothetical protein
MIRANREEHLANGLARLHAVHAMMPSVPSRTNRIVAFLRDQTVVPRLAPRSDAC